MTKQDLLTVSSVFDRLNEVTLETAFEDMTRVETRHEAEEIRNAAVDASIILEARKELALAYAERAKP
jgi:hypothetical protein